VCCEHFGFYRKTNVEIEFGSKWIEFAQICPKTIQFSSILHQNYSISLKFAPKWLKITQNHLNLLKVAPKCLKMCVKLPPLIFAPKMAQLHSNLTPKHSNLTQNSSDLTQIRSDLSQNKLKIAQI
jgi:hypothetical protein